MICRFAIAFSFGLLASHPAPPEDDALIDRLREVAVPLESPGDLDPLIERVTDNVRLVLLGESTHGTREFYTWRDAISRRLITESGFNFIAVEGDWAAIAELDRYVRDYPGAGAGVGAKESAKKALLTFDRWPLWMWANEEIVELAEWLRSHNDEKPREKRVGIFGIDVYGADRAMERVPQLLEPIDAELAQRARHAYECFAAHVNDPRGYVQGIALGGPSCERDIVSVVSMIRAAMDEAKNEKAAADDSLFRAKQKALAVKRAERHFRAGLQGQVASWNARADHFYLATQRLLEHFGEDSRGVVWAHNTHIGDGRATQMGQVGMLNIGRMAREALGQENVLLVGFSTYEGEALAARQWEGAMERMTLPPAARGSLDWLLNEVNQPSFLFFTSDVADQPEFARAMTHRAVGVTFQPEQERAANYPPSLPAERFDAIIFVRETTPVRAVHDVEGEPESGN